MPWTSKERSVVMDMCQVFDQEMDPLEIDTIQKETTKLTLTKLT